MSATVVFYLRGEISSAQHFDAESLFLSYCILVPNGWTCPEESKLCGTTHFAQQTRKPFGDEGKSISTAHLNQYFEAKLIAPVDLVFEVPKLMVEVSSLDWWQRFCTEGYGFTAIPTSPGHHSLTIATWRPVPSPMHSQAARVAQMRRFFIGGTPQLKDLGCSLADTQGKDILSRFGLCTISSGQVNVTLEVGLQGPKDGKILAKSTLLGKKMQSGRSDQLVSSVDQVIAAYLRVKSRMASVREAMKTMMDERQSD
ncbi:Hypothetical predicted protein [Cloeon dipterum]|uniref:Uncharacterized protein n=2 Tax=Cloeon dipterum TaxID=197152 RepID=A0A8S1EAN1_9INSE|nr:Hypothetical predicted protein [Cloeon dipterum]